MRMAAHSGRSARVAVVTTALAGLAAVPSASATEPAYYPSRLAHVGDAAQLLVVTGNSSSSSHATLRAYERGADGVWRLAFSPMAARSGYAGWVNGPARVENSGTSPIGTYGLTTAFGLASNPGVKLQYLHVDQDDYMAAAHLADGVSDVRTVRQLPHPVPVRGDHRLQPTRRVQHYLVVSAP